LRLCSEEAISGASAFAVIEGIFWQRWPICPAPLEDQEEQTLQDMKPELRRVARRSVRKTNSFTFRDCLNRILALPLASFKEAKRPLFSNYFGRALLTNRKGTPKSHGRILGELTD